MKVEIMKNGVLYLEATTTKESAHLRKMWERGVQVVNISAAELPVLGICYSHCNEIPSKEALPTIEIEAKLKLMKELQNGHVENFMLIADAIEALIDAKLARVKLMLQVDS